MPLWGNTDVASASPKYGTELLSGGPVGSGNVAKAANNTALYGSAAVGTFVPGKAVGQFSVSAAAMANTGGEAKKVTHAGWTVRTAGTGPVANVAPTAAGTGYSNTDLVRVSGGTTNASFAVLTNGAGGILSLSPVVTGAGFTNVTTVAVTNSTGGASAGSGATFSAALGGRAGRVTHETIVAGGFASTSNAIFPV
jgi:hypothetical protein